MVSMKSVRESIADDRVALHPAPSEDAVKVYIPVDDDVYKERFDFEEVYARRTSDVLQKRYQILSIPFIIYGVNKGDIVEINSSRIVSKTLTDDGQYGYRVAFLVPNDNDRAHEQVSTALAILNDEKFETETFNHKISAVNAMNADEAVRLESLLHEMIKNGQIIGFDTIR